MLMLTPGGFVDRRPCRSRPRITSSTPQATNRPPMIRRRSNRFAARSVAACIAHPGISYQKTIVRTAAPASTAPPSIFGDSHQCVVSRDALVDVGHAVDEALQILDRLGLA